MSLWRELCEGEEFPKLAEGVSTVKALMVLAKRYEIELPICESVYCN